MNVSLLSANAKFCPYKDSSVPTIDPNIVAKGRWILGLAQTHLRRYSLSSEFDVNDDCSSSFRSEESPERLCWRPWPCAVCSEGGTPIGFLLAGINSGEVLSNGSPEAIALSQITALRKWADSCPHLSNRELLLPRLAAGSEHIVYFNAGSAEVYKVTWPQIYGDAYYLDASGRINQRNCSPLEYLIRLRLWRKIFAFAPGDLGLTASGQIVTSYPFILGTQPSQDLVDSFLFDAGLCPVRQEYWLWKKSWPDFEIWLGDARSDNL